MKAKEESFKINWGKFRIHPYLYLISFGIMGKVFYEFNYATMQVKDLIESAPPKFQNSEAYMQYYRRGEENDYQSLTPEELNSLQKQSELLATSGHKILNQGIKLYPLLTTAGLIFQFNYFGSVGWRFLPILTTSVSFLLIALTNFFVITKRGKLKEVLTEWQRVNQEIKDFREVTGN
uniref:Uncharacterized protein n=1 Tax=Euplotes crassus TaxID=5936 RepID=A0A7S3P141_EUPCR|mmetsp:Transcript_6352/g.5926  ORF Transcript_6352/g.5926 Transcript_6352/m.5926 type:complete len:178 (+) Transcript_6352:126-659(+)